MQGRARRQAREPQTFLDALWLGVCRGVAVSTVIVAASITVHIYDHGRPLEVTWQPQR